MPHAKLWCRVLGLLLLYSASVPAAENPLPGQWIKRGLPLSGDEFPACYQLWVCAAGDKPAQAGDKQARQRPLGTWGTCENMLQSAASQCGECLAPEPEQPCLPACPEGGDC